MASVDLEVGGRRVDAQAVGRDAAPVPVDQPDVLDGSWVEPGGIVVEAAFAEALGVAVGDTVLLDGASFRVVGAAVSAASAPYPDETCFAGPCTGDAGVLWLTDADVANLDVPPERISHVVNLQLSDPDTAQAFIDAHGFNQPPQPPAQSWQEITDAADSRYRHQRRALLVGSWVLAVLAVASMAVLVGSRTADQSRRVGLLKAVGATPLTVAGILLAEYVIVALVAAAVGLAGGWLVAPLLTDPAEGLLGTASSPRLSASSIGVVTAMALAVAIAATLGPAVRAARTSTAGALLAPTRPPRRIGWLIDLSARLPAWLLLGIRLIAQRPRRTVLAAASVFVTVSGVVAVLGAHAEVDRGDLDLDSAAIDRLNRVLLVIGLALGVLAAINAIASTWATATRLATAVGPRPRARRHTAPGVRRALGGTGAAGARRRRLGHPRRHPAARRSGPRRRNDATALAAAGGGAGGGARCRRAHGSAGAPRCAHLRRPGVASRGALSEPLCRTDVVDLRRDSVAVRDVDPALHDKPIWWSGAKSSSCQSRRRAAGSRCSASFGWLTGDGPAGGNAAASPARRRSGACTARARPDGRRLTGRSANDTCCSIDAPSQLGQAADDANRVRGLLALAGAPCDTADPARAQAAALNVPDRGQHVHDQRRLRVDLGQPEPGRHA